VNSHLSFPCQRSATQVDPHSLLLIHQRSPPLSHPISVSSFFYKTNTNFLSTLKTSLSQTMSMFYCLSGRLSHNAIAIHCNDGGIDLTEARATANALLSRLVPCSNLNSLKLMLPCNIEDEHGDFDSDLQILILILISTLKPGLLRM